MTSRFGQSICSRFLRALISRTPALQEGKLTQQRSLLSLSCFIGSTSPISCTKLGGVRGFTLPPRTATTEQNVFPSTSALFSLSTGSIAANRGLSSLKGPQPRFKGGKVKLHTAFKERFKLRSDGTIKMFRPGFRHRRSRKGNAQRLRLKSPTTMHQTYANTLRRMGFK